MSPGQGIQGISREGIPNRTAPNSTRSPAMTAAFEDVRTDNWCHPFRMKDWLERRRHRAEIARQWAALGDCDACGHPWSEHAGTANDLDGMCGECAYEFEHGERPTDGPGCMLTLLSAP